MAGLTPRFPGITMQTSAQGRTALKSEEGEVLKAYRDVAGNWTIGVGLTAASGVVKPVASMVITAEQSDALLTEALRKNYEPAVEMAMTVTEGAITRPAQNEFDAGVSFHFNTGSIAKASWVKLWKERSGRFNIRLAFTAWSKAGGKVLPSLKARREREFAMLMDGIYYRAAEPVPAPNQLWAQWGIKLSSAEIRAVFEGLTTLGYQPGDGSVPTLTSVTAFQRAHDLTPDGIIGRATLSTLQRALDARKKATLPVAAVVAVPAAVASGVTEQIAAIPHSDTAAIALAVLWLAQHLWSYRDIAAASLAPTFPRIAAYLRSF